MRLIAQRRYPHAPGYLVALPGKPFHTYRNSDHDLLHLESHIVRPHWLVSRLVRRIPDQSNHLVRASLPIRIIYFRLPNTIHWPDSPLRTKRINQHVPCTLLHISSHC
jgi:hypothetical protein